MVGVPGFCSIFGLGFEVSGLGLEVLEPKPGTPLMFARVRDFALETSYPSAG